MTASRRARIETALLVVVLALSTAFVVSFARGLGAGPRDRDSGRVTATSAASANVDTRRVGRVEVLNAANIAGLARTATERLRDAGFDVVYFGTATSEPADTSLVYARIADDEIARSVADVLGISRVVSAPDSTLYVDASAVLGKDWKPASRRP